jgi:multicomponent Na+:H+ antiporter subunit B
MSPWLDFVLFSILAVTAVGVVVLRHLFAVVMLGGVFSLVTAGLFVVLDAPDVAFTEAAVGAGVVTVLLLGAIALTTRREKPATSSVAVPLTVCIITGLVLIYGTLDLPRFGAPDAPIHSTWRRNSSSSASPRSTSPTSSPRCWRATAASTLWARSSWSSPPASACFC